MSTPITITVQEAMERHSGFTYGTWNRMLNSGKIPAVKVGKMWRINVEQLDKIMARGMK